MRKPTSILCSFRMETCFVQDVSTFLFCVTKMASGREAIIEFINKYKELECLWKVNDKDYRNKHKRLNATEQLLQIIKKTEPSANMDSVNKKINSLRSSFNKEHNKVKASYRSGAGTDEVHIPKLWYYDLLLFLADRDIEVRKSSGIAEVLNETTPEHEDIEDFTDVEPPSPCYSQSSTSTNMSNYSKRSIRQNASQQNNESAKKKLKTTATEVLSKISNRLDVPKSKKKYSAFGEHVAEKLREMDERMALYCQKLINDAIFQADCGNLNYSSRIVTEYQHSQVPQSQLPQTQLPQSQLLQTQLPQSQLLQTQLPQSQLPQTQLPQSQLPQTQLPQSQLPQTQLPQSQLLQTQLPQIQLLQGQQTQTQQPSAQQPLTQPSHILLSPVQMPLESHATYRATLYNDSNENTISLPEVDDDAVLNKYIEALRNK